MAQETLSSTRTAVAVAVAACSLTLTAGITTAALLGYLGRAAPETAPAATSTEAGSALGAPPGVVLVPVRPAVEEPAVPGDGGEPDRLRYASLREGDRDDRRGHDRERRHEHEDDD